VTTERPLTIIIDELDRCKPSFAVSIIENIKHVFDSVGVNFILITNTVQLYASINHMYGISVNSRQYLDKFIKFSITLPTHYKHLGNSLVNASEQHWRNISKNDNVLLNANAGSEKMISSLINQGGLSLREVETFARHIKIFQVLTNNSINSNALSEYTFLEIFGIFLYSFNKKSAESVVDKTINLDTIGDALNIQNFNYTLNRERSTIQLVLYGLIRESNCNSTRFPRPTPEQKQQWDTFLTSHYQNTNYEANGFSLVVASAINTLMLSL